MKGASEGSTNAAGLGRYMLTNAQPQKAIEGHPYYIG
jgi:hypothetical protein